MNPTKNQIEELKATELTLNDYQKLAEGTAIFPKELSIEYPLKGLVGEVGEMFNKLKKLHRDNGIIKIDKHNIPAVIHDALIGEMGDILWYLALLCKGFGESLGELGKSNLLKLYGRKEDGTIQGSGDER